VNPWYNTAQKYSTLKNSFSIVLLVAGTYSLKNALNNYHQFKDRIENYDEIKDNNPEEAFDSWHTDRRKEAIKTIFWSATSIASFASAVYCLKNNFY
jgi:hypothetical protein